MPDGRLHAGFGTNLAQPAKRLLSASINHLRSADFGIMSAEMGRDRPQGAAR